MQRINKALFITLLFFVFSFETLGSPVFEHSVKKPLSEVYDSVYKGLEDARFYVVFEANIGANISRFAERWGDNYNRNQLDGIRSLVFCNGWYANEVSNLDPKMLALCPLSLSLIEKQGKTTALFIRPSAIDQNSPAKKRLLELENEVIAAIKKAM